MIANTVALLFISTGASVAWDYRNPIKGWLRGL